MQFNDFRKFLELTEIPYPHMINVFMFYSPYASLGKGIIPGF